MVAIKSVSDIAAKWARVTPGRSADYEAGVRSPRASWSSNAAAAEPAFQAGVQGAIQRKAYSGGVRKAGDEKWSRKSLSVGVSRFGPGVGAAQPDFQAGFEPFAATIAGTSIPARRAKGDPANIARVTLLADALHKKRLAMTAGGA